MKLEAPLSVEISFLNDFRYYWSLRLWQISLIQLDLGWPPTLIVKILGIGFRLEIEWWNE